jgi:hypothetical protein
LDPCWLHPTEGLLQAYAAFLAATCSADTIKNQLAGLKYHLGSFGPVDWSGYTLLQQQLKGIRRMRGACQQQKRPITMEMLLCWVLQLQRGWDSRVQCLVLACVIGVFGMLRRSNLVPGSSSLFEGRKHLRRRDVVFVPELYALRLTLRETKTLQFQEREHVIFVTGSRGAPLDHVRLYQEYVAVHPAGSEDPLFMFKGADGVLQPLFDGLASGVKELVALLGLDPSKYASHSLRRGGASGALASGLEPFFTRFQGDWKSECYLRYYTLGLRDMLRKLRNVLSLPDASTKLLRFVSDDIWGSRGRCRVISRSIAEYLVQAWDVRNSCKHNGAVLPIPSAPEGRGADGIDAMA